ncbi:hypothetical protein ABKV19_021722 [Rosa sericea]
MLRPHKKLKPSPDLSPPPLRNDAVSELYDAGKNHDQSPSRRWEELDRECLANVFAKVGMDSLLLALPFVCKSWYDASHNPLCWKFLHFPEFEPYPLFTAVPVADANVEPKSFGPFYNKFVEDYQIDSSRFSITGFIKLVVNRSKGKALELKLPQFCTEEALRYVADACPGIRYLQFSDDLVLFKHSQILPEVIGKWKFLERLTLGGNMENIMKQFQVKSGEQLSRDFEETLSSLDSVSRISNKNLHEILVQVGIHCKRLRALHIFDVCVGQAEAEAIVTGVPNLVFLTLGSSRIERNTLVTLLQGCKKLCCFNVWNCEGFVVDAEEMQELGSHIREFRWTRDLTGYKCYHVLKMVILTRARLTQILRKRNNSLGIDH